MALWVFFLYPETAGKSLEEIDYVFEAKIPAWKSAGMGGTFADRVHEVEQKREGHHVEVTHEEAAPVGTTNGEKEGEQV